MATSFLIARMNAQSEATKVVTVDQLSTENAGVTNNGHGQFYCFA